MVARSSAGARAATAVALLLALGATSTGCTGGSGGPNPDPAPSRIDVTVRVLSEGGARISDAKVLAGTLTGTTNVAGEVVFRDVPAGSYNITAEAPPGPPGHGFIAYGRFTLNAAVPLAELVITQAPAEFMIIGTSAFLEDDLRLDQAIALEFSAAPDRTTLEPEDFQFSPDIGEVIIAPLPLAGEGSFTVRPRRQLPPGQFITLTLSGQVLSEQGEALRVPFRMAFRTAPTDAAAPVFIESTPRFAAADHPPNVPVVLMFNEPLDPSLILLDVIGSDDETVEVEISALGSSVYLLPAGGWQPETRYTIMGGVTDLLGNARSSFSVGPAFNFTTSATPAPSRNIHPEWSRALDRIVFASDRGGGFDLYSIAPDGSELRRLTERPGDELHPSMSSDGALLAWQGRGEAGDWDVYAAPLLDTGSASALTAAPSSETQPVFARTSSRLIYFVSDRLGDSAIHRMGPDGSGATALAPAFGGAQLDPMPHPLVDNQLLLASPRGGSYDIWSLAVSAVDGSASALGLTETLLATEREPDWSPDADFIAYISDESGAEELWIQSLGGGLARQVTSFGSALSGPSVSPLSGANTAAASLTRSGGGSDIVIIDLVGGDVLLNLTGEASH